MITINRMMSIVLVLIFMVPLAMFSYSMVSSAEAAAGNTMQIDEQIQMTQLIFYTTSISYQCTDEIGGYEKGLTDATGTYWTDWEFYREHPNFNWNHLEEAGSDLECYGATSTLPMAEGFWAEALPNYQGWLNDQTGEYSRKSFVITEEGDGDVQIGPCIAYTQGGEGEDAVLLFADNEKPAITNYRQGGGLEFATEVEYDFSGGLNPGSDCYAPGGNVGSSTSGGPVITTIIMGEVPDTDDISGNEAGVVSGVAGWEDFSSGWMSESGPEDFDAPYYTLCEGTTGYVQSNPGANEDEFDGGDYSPNNPPGDPSLVATDGLVGGDEEANVIHPYIVITNWEDDCYD